MSQPNIKDIAAHVGVCQATVSRTLRTPDMVRPETRKKVLDAIKKMGYSPNKLGASLRQGKSLTVVVATPDITNPYYSPIVRAIEKVAMERGYSVLLGDTIENPAVEAVYGNMVTTKQADGIIICSQRLPFDVPTSDQHAPNLPPIVSTAEVVPHPFVHKVVVDNEGVGYTGLKHLLDLGHRNIGIIAGLADHKSTIDRLTGCKNALCEFGLELKPELIFYSDYTSESGMKGAECLLQASAKPSAFFCFGDLIAVGAMHTLHELGYSIPQDASVVGVDDVFLSKFLYPSLTTVAQPLSLIGTRCMELLLQLINGETPEKTLNIVPHGLVVRKSCGPVPAN